MWLGFTPEPYSMFPPTYVTVSLIDVISAKVNNVLYNDLVLTKAITTFIAIYVVRIASILFYDSIMLSPTIQNIHYL